MVVVSYFDKYFTETFISRSSCRRRRVPGENVLFRMFFFFVRCLSCAKKDDEPSDEKAVVELLICVYKLWLADDNLVDYFHRKNHHQRFFFVVGQLSVKRFVVHVESYRSWFGGSMIFRDDRWENMSHSRPKACVNKISATWMVLFFPDLNSTEKKPLHHPSNHSWLNKQKRKKSLQIIEKWFQFFCLLSWELFWKKWS